MGQNSEEKNVFDMSYRVGSLNIWDGSGRAKAFEPMFISVMKSALSCFLAHGVWAYREFEPGLPNLIRHRLHSLHEPDSDIQSYRNGFSLLAYHWSRIAFWIMYICCRSTASHRHLRFVRKTNWLVPRHKLSSALGLACFHCRSPIRWSGILW